MKQQAFPTNEAVPAKRSRRARAVRRISVVIAVAVTLFLIIPMVFSAYSTAPFAYVVQAAETLKNGLAPQSVSVTDSALDVHGLVYSETYPSSTLDILYAEEADAPTFVFIHGGGDLTGDNLDTDILPLLESIRRAGFHVVTLDYALMPDGPFPIPVRQTARAMLWLREHAGEYGLDTGRIILMGQSSGAAIAAQYTAACQNLDYAAALGLDAEAQYPVPKGLILDDAPLDTTRMAWGRKLVICNYIAGRTVLTGEEAALYDAAHHFTAGMPSCFIIGSRAYRKDASRIADAVRAAGGDAELYDPFALYRERKRHCFINSASTDDVACEAMEKVLAFALQRTGSAG